MSDPQSAGSGALIAIGGHEDRDGERTILRAVAAAMRGGPLLIVATASRKPFAYLQRYRGAFEGIGVHDVRDLAVRTRADADDPHLAELIAIAGGVFITGGSQLRLIEPLRDSGVHAALRELHARGGVIAGTSAGASALGECMLAGSNELRLTDGLGLIEGVMIDQHFSQRQRLGRLKDAVERRSQCLGIGIDEDTALVVRDGRGSTIGAGQVWVVEDGRPVRELGGDTITL